MDNCDVLKKARWTEPIDLYIGTIVEYDMKDGGNSILHDNHLLPQEELDYIDSIPKGMKRNDYVGKLNYNKKYKGIGKELESQFCKYRCLFGLKNELTNEDIISVKRDAIFTKKYCYELQLGERVRFAEKHVYQAYLSIGKYEFWWNEDGIDIKGIKDDKLVRHKDYLIKIIWVFMRYLQEFDFEKALKYIVKTMNDYKMLRLDPDVYREFNDAPYFKLRYKDKIIDLEEAGADVLPQLDISYNYMNILVPMMNLVAGR